MTRTKIVVTSRIISVGFAFAVSSSFHGVTTVSKPRGFGYAAGSASCSLAAIWRASACAAPAVAPGTSRAYTSVIRCTRSFCIDALMQ